MSPRCLLLVLFVLSCTLANAQTKNLYIAPGGNDHHNGGLHHPFGSLQKAVEAASIYTNKNVRIILRGGTYYLDTTVVLNSSGGQPLSLQITAYKNERVIVSAGRRLRLSWIKYKNGIYGAAIPRGISFERLYINGKAQPLARFPDYNDTSRVYNGTSPDALSPERVKRWKNPAGGYVHALHAGEWGSFDYLITGLNADGTLKLIGGWQNNRPSPMNAQYRFVENIFEELDAPGEWYLDKARSFLYYYPPKKINLKGACVEVSRHKISLALLGTLQKPLHKITISQINFRHNERSFMDTREPLLRGDWCIYRGGAVLLSGTESCKITGCTFEGLGGNAIMLSNYNKNDTISKCLVANIGASAVCFIGDPNAVRTPLFKYEATVAYNELDKTPGPLTQNFPQQCVVNNNLFHHLGEIEKQATGVEISMSASIMVSRNTIYNTPRAGININDGCWGGHVVAYNDVFNTVLETGDHGAFNSWGRDRYWSANRSYMDSLLAIHPELILIDAQKPVVIHDNRFRCDHGWDIDLDDGSTNYLIYNNICLNGGLKLREGFFRVATNNVLINNTLSAHAWFKNSHDVFKHNIVMKKYAPYAVADWGNNVEDNVFPDSSALNDARKNGTDAHSIVGLYQPNNNRSAYIVGFKEIPDDEFGVTWPALKKLALKPAMPMLTVALTAEIETSSLSFLGGTIKSVDGLGERSVYGLHAAKGVIVISAGQNSLLSKWGIKDRDVVTEAGNKTINNTDDLITFYQSAKEGTDAQLTIYRNQQALRLIVRIKP